MDEQQGFWKWYLSALVFVFSFRWARSGWAEYITGVLVTIFCSIGLGYSYSPLWLLVTVPAGSTMAVHGLWRVKRREAKR